MQWGCQEKLPVPFPLTPQIQTLKPTVGLLLQHSEFRCPVNPPLHRSLLPCLLLVSFVHCPLTFHPHGQGCQPQPLCAEIPLSSASPHTWHLCNRDVQTTAHLFQVSCFIGLFWMKHLFSKEAVDRWRSMSVIEKYHEIFKICDYHLMHSYYLATLACMHLFVCLCFWAVNLCFSVPR